MNFMKHSPWLLSGSWLVLCLAVVLAGMAQRLSPIEQEMIQPGFLGPMLVPLALVFSAIAVLLLWISSGHARSLMLQAPLAELILFFPLVYAFVWLVLPVRGLRALDVVIMGIFMLAAGWLVYRSRFTRPIPRPALSRTFPVDLALILMPVILGLAWGMKPDFQSSGISILLYPAYALIQLAVFLVIPAARLHRFGLKPWQIALFCATAFGLMHAPNPLVTAVTFLAMFIWARQYLAGRRIWQLAVVMGLSATTFSQFLADDFTGHMRVGPGYLRVQAIETLAFADYTPEQSLPDNYLQLIYPKIVERQATADELEVWVELIAKARRTTMAWQFFTSEEYARKSMDREWPAPPPEETHWVLFPPEWRHRIAAFGSEIYWRRCGGNFTGFTKCLYRDILQRGGSAKEIAGWKANLTVGQRKRLASVLLEQRLELGTWPFTGLTVKELRLSR